MNEPELNIEARLAEAVKADPTYFPGRDYPDREEWLKRRATPKGQVWGRWVYRAVPSPSAPIPQPLALGINNAKRRVDGDQNPKDARSGLVAERHKYWGKLP